MPRGLNAKSPTGMVLLLLNTTILTCRAASLHPNNMVWQSQSRKYLARRSVTLPGAVPSLSWLKLTWTNLMTQTYQSIKVLPRMIQLQPFYQKNLSPKGLADYSKYQNHSNLDCYYPKNLRKDISIQSFSGCYILYHWSIFPNNDSRIRASFSKTFHVVTTSTRINWVWDISIKKPNNVNQ